MTRVQDTAQTRPGAEHEKPRSKGDGRIKWITPQWLRDHKDEHDLLVIDVQPNVHDYLSCHIPGAVYMNEGMFRGCSTLPTAWLPPSKVAPLLQGIGLVSGQPVVVYTSPGPLSACRKYLGDGLEQTMVAYTLARYGHPSVYVLDGGLVRWQEEDLPTDQRLPLVRDSDFTTKVDRDLFVGYDEFVALKDRDDVVLLDARPPAIYAGQGPWPKPGHIPGAVNLPWSSFMDAKNRALLRPEEEIVPLVQAAGATPDKTILCYCGTGREATNEFILFKWYLGYPRVKLFEGSFTEWTAHPENPTVTGDHPR
ncbi:MAG: sulfurtransferase [Methanobacteriota archaeon]|nr:MAG: sulfurtransferase [Euryarchaeota archaeon]